MSHKGMKISLVGVLLMIAVHGLATSRVAAQTPLISSVVVTQYPRYSSREGSDCTTGGTPFAVRVHVEGQANQPITLGIGLASATCTYDAKPVNPAWIPPAAENHRFPRFTIGSDGTLDAWIYGRRDTTGTVGNLMRVIAFPCNADYTNCTATIGPHVQSSPVTVTRMDMTPTTGDGGWLEESGGDRLGNTIVAVKNSGGTLIGMYRTENNSVEEGYSYGSGGYKVAVPACTNCNYSIETWSASNPGTPLGNVNVMGTTCSVNDIAAGATVSLDNPVCSNPTAITLISFSARGQPEGKTILLAVTLVLVTLATMFLQRRLVLEN
ncbi:MAG TPA: hypothetical protein VLA49_07670 [Anaerolineales bacterium]|nr:hypothetical protein [Anaerolineales bacterium]